MDKTIDGLKGGILRRARASYRSIPSSQFLRPDVPGIYREQAAFLALHTRFGILYSTMRLEMGCGDDLPVLMLDFDTKAPTPELARWAAEDLGETFDPLPENVVWDAGVYTSLKIKSAHPFLLTKGRIEFAECYHDMSAGGNKRVAKIDHQVKSETSVEFMEKIALKIIRELNGMGVLKEAAVLSVLKFKADFQSPGYKDDMLPIFMLKIDKMLGQIQDPDVRAAILTHADRSVRVAGMPIVKRSGGVVAASAGKPLANKGAVRTK